MAQRGRMETIGAAWRALDRDATLVWGEYARASVSDQDGAKRNGVSGYNAFSALASTLLRLAPEGPLPQSPPTGPFFGDAVAISAVGGASLTFSASQANAAGVVTELLIQPLASAGRTPRPRGYVSAGFATFVEGALEATVEAPSGWVACAYRFVRADTGQETGLAPCGVVRAT